MADTEMAGGNGSEAVPRVKRPIDMAQQPVPRGVLKETVTHIYDQLSKIHRRHNEKVRALEERIAALEAKTAKTMRYSGVWSADKQYDEGMVATWNGSWWLCLKHTTAKPGSDRSAWQLTVKRNGT